MLPPKRPIPGQAFAAIDPAGGPIDIDLARKTVSGAEHAARMATGRPWPELAARGWIVQPVLVDLAIKAGAVPPIVDAEPMRRPRRRRADPMQDSAATARMRLLRCQ